MTDFDFLSYTVELDMPEESQDMVGIKIKMPKACVYENEKGKTEYCPICNHDDVPYCQFLDDDEVGIGVDERPCYCPLVEIKEHTPERTQTHSCDNQYCIQNGGDICDRVHCPIGQKQTFYDDITDEQEQLDFVQKHERIPVTLDVQTHEDVISRQAAIDALWAERMKHSEEIERNLETCSFSLRVDNKARRNRIEEDIEIIKQLPSVEPEIIRCSACKHWNQTSGETKRFGLGECNFHDAKFVTCNGYCYWAERREDG